MLRTLLGVFLQISGAAVVILTGLAALVYMVFMVVWLHAPPVQVIGLSLALSVPCVLLACGIFVLGRWVRRGA